MKWMMGVLGAILLMTACKKDTADNSGYPIAGRFTGNFYRTGMDTVQVTLLFKTDNGFEASGGRLYYPALCSGTYTRNGSQLVINDTCSWTANFDWSLIFDGNYDLQFTDANRIRILRTNGSVTDTYELYRLLR